MGRRIARWIALAVAVYYLVFGFWAFAFPRSFADVVATFAPFNQHLLHDVGAFQLGLAATLLAALIWRDSLVAALVGVGVGSAMHLVAHVIDAGLGGRAVDPWALGVVVLLVIAGLALADRRSRRPADQRR